jgi:hypothetical protein
MTLPPDLPPSTGLTKSISPGIDFPAESFFDVYYEVDLPDAGQQVIVNTEMAPRIEAIVPIEYLPPLFSEYVDYEYTPFFDRQDPATPIGWLRPHLTVMPLPTDTCCAFGDIDGDGLALHILDLTYLISFVHMGGYPPIYLYEADLNGDCHIDQLDIDMFQCYIVYGLSCFPQYPVPTCCYPDTVRGACCDYQLDSCRILAPENCDLTGGDYKGNDVPCDPDPCGEVCDCIPGDSDNNLVHNILDITYLIRYLYKGGPAPILYALCSGDADCDCAVNLLDVTYLINHLYREGPPPCDCETWLSICGPPLRN